jgi:hypothetical protein
LLRTYKGTPIGIGRLEAHLPIIRHLSDVLNEELA